MDPLQAKLISPGFFTEPPCRKQKLLLDFWLQKGFKTKKIIVGEYYEAYRQWLAKYLAKPQNIINYIIIRSLLNNHSGRLPCSEFLEALEGSPQNTLTDNDFFYVLQRIPLKDLEYFATEIFMGPKTFLGPLRTGSYHLNLPSPGYDLVVASYL